MKPALQNLYELLTSEDEANILLALNRLPNYEPLEEIFLTPLLYYGFLPNKLTDTTIIRKSQQFFEQNTSDSLKEAVNKYQSKYLNQYHTFAYKRFNPITDDDEPLLDILYKDWYYQFLKEIISHSAILDKKFFFEKTCSMIPKYSRQNATMYILHCLENYDEINEAAWITSINARNITISCLSKIIRKLPKAESIDFSGCKINEFTADIPENYTLKYLHLSDCQISDLPDTIGNLHSLEKLDLSNNFISKLPENIWSLEKLRDLSLWSNRIENISNRVSQLKNLSGLHLSGNKISQLPESIADLSKLEFLYLRENKLERLPESIGNLASLTRLDLNSNQLSDLPDTLGKLTKLSFLGIAGNLFKDFPRIVLELKNLSDFDYSHNQLFVLPKDIERLTKLSELNLSHNQLSELPKRFYLLKSLNKLYLNNNNLTKLTEDFAFEGLYLLNISHNKLTEIPESIGKLPFLQLEASNNLLTSFFPNLRGASELRWSRDPQYPLFLTLSDNPFPEAEKNRIHKFFSDAFDRITIRI
jgi:Leucine-rich repeat (LRR) protein